jgi:hypothetical protein
MRSVLIAQIANVNYKELKELSSSFVEIYMLPSIEDGKMEWKKVDPSTLPLK